MQIQRFGNTYMRPVMKNYVSPHLFHFLGIFHLKGKRTYSPFCKTPPKSKNEKD